jgi:hypothetical protein
VRQGEHETLSLSDYSSKDVQQAERAATRELDTEIEKAARTIPEHREEPAGFETNGRRVVRSQALQRELSPMMVATGEIKPELAPMYERVLRDEADGKAITMNSLARSVPRPRPPKRPSWARWER